MENQTPFLFTACQNGAEHALKQELARSWPDFRFAFSRPGFVTFKLPADWGFTEHWNLASIFARTCGFCLGKTTANIGEAAAAEVWNLVSDRDVHQIHVWERDRLVPGDQGFAPGETPLAKSIGELLATSKPSGVCHVNAVAHRNDLVMDCVIVEPQQWWVGYHRASVGPSCWPGGVPPITPPPDMLSRAYLKMQESLMWSRLPIKKGDRCVEIGSSPGGSCQALLGKGLVVTGIDPAEMAPEVLAHPNFVHIRARGADLKRREFRGIKWLMADSNVAPKHTLATVEHIVTNRQVNVRGMLLTLKLNNWDLAAEIPAYLERIASWGYDDVRAKQLAFNRREICVAACKRK